MIEVGIGWLILSSIISMFVGSMVRFGTEGVEENLVDDELTIAIEWLLISVSVIDVDTGRVRVKLCGEEYPYEPDFYEFPSLELAMDFVKQETFRLLTEE